MGKVWKYVLLWKLVFKIFTALIISFFQMAFNCYHLFRLQKLPVKKLCSHIIGFNRIVPQSSKLFEVRHSFIVSKFVRNFRGAAVLYATDCKKSKLLKESKFNIFKEKLESQTENIFTIPNGLSLLRIMLTPVLGYLVISNCFYEAFITLTVAGVTDLLDGYIARNYENQKSVLGSFLDPFADKLLLSTLFISMACADLIPVSLTALVLSRDFCLVVGAAYLRYKSVPAPKTIAKLFDFKYATIQLFPTTISKVNTGFQLSAVALTLGASLFGMNDHTALHFLWWLTAGTTVSSGLSYLVCRNTYKFLKPHKTRM